MAFSEIDLFVVGLGLDATGAILLARGLLAKPALLYKLASTFWGMNVGDAVDRAQSRVDAMFGVACLVGGFIFQAIGYTVELAGADANTGVCRAVTAVVLLALAMAGSYGLYKLLAPRYLKRTLVAMAASKPEEDDQGAPIEGWTMERAKRLRDFGVAAGWTYEGEDDDEDATRAYVTDTFGVDIPPFRNIPEGQQD